MSAVRMQGLVKRFGKTIAVDAVDLAVEDGELFFLLGPSGCGKTTLLRMVAGFIAPSAGTIFFGEREVTDVPPNRRGTGMVFQSYALWPHMTVFDNVAYGLRVRKVAAPQRRERVERALATVEMAEYARRKPNELSGGQQQRVALARALVVKPTVLLLDEPLSNLDARLRLDMRERIRRICNESGITTIYVTHDQKEALSMADRIAVLRGGRVMQVGPPRELYDRPASRFVADFLGETNFLGGEIGETADGTVRIETPAGSLRSACAPPGLARGRRVTCSVRPEALRLGPGPSPNRLPGTRLHSVYLGELAQHVVALAGGAQVRAVELNPGPLGAPGEAVELTVDPADVVVLEE